LTFSLIAIDLEEFSIGIGVVSGSYDVRSRVPWVKLGVGAIATQAYTNVDYGKTGLELLEKGYAPKEAYEYVRKTDRDWETRQVGIIDMKNRKFVYTGSKCPEWKGEIVGENYIIIGNLLTGKEVLEKMEEGFLTTKGSLLEKIFEALKHGSKVGGDKRGNKTAAIVVHTKNKIIDISIKYSSNPIRDLEEKIEALK